MTIQVKDLKDQIGTIGLRPFLYCSICGAEYSANAGDYWSVSPDYVFECCGVPMLLVTKHVEYREVEP